MDKSELPKIVTTILNRHYYVLWSQDMTAFSKAIVYGAISQVKSKLLFVLRMKTTRSSLIVLKTRIARITKSSLGFAILLSLPFISNLVTMKMLRMFGIF